MDSALSRAILARTIALAATRPPSRADALAYIAQINGYAAPLHQGDGRRVALRLDLPAMRGDRVPMRLGGALTADQAAALTAKALGNARMLESTHLALTDTRSAVAVAPREEAGPRASKLVDATRSRLRRIELSLQSGLFNARVIEAAQEILSSLMEGKDGLDLDATQAAELESDVTTYQRVIGDELASIRGMPGDKRADSLHALEKLLAASGEVLTQLRQWRLSGLNAADRASRLSMLRRALFEASKSRAASGAALAAAIRASFAAPAPPVAVPAGAGAGAGAAAAAAAAAAVAPVVAPVVAPEYAANVDLARRLLSQQTVDELRGLARRLNLRGRGQLTKAGLVEAILHHP